MYKRIVAFALICVLALMWLPAQADDAGVLTEVELSTWLNKLLLSTLDVTPINAPVGEESLTEDGYAFIYPTVTLYYNKPQLDAQSVLQSIAITDETLDMPRGIQLGSSADMLIAVYGWQNPSLAGDESFAPLYTLDQLPVAAYWAWAQRSGDQIQSVQCTIHAQMGKDRYTDTGILYAVENGEVTGIRIYGVSAAVSLADVRSNMDAVGGVQGMPQQQAIAGVTAANQAEPFAQADLQFARMDFLTFTEAGAAVIFGAPVSEDWAQDDDGEWMHTLAYSGATLMFVSDANRQNPRLESMSVTGNGFAGPRGVAIGTALDAAVALFKVDGAGATSDSAALLYGDGHTPPYGTLERIDSDVTLRYAAVVTGAGGQTFGVALHLSFVNTQLAEIMIYRL